MSETGSQKLSKSDEKIPKAERRQAPWNQPTGLETLLELLNQLANQPTNQPTSEPTDFLMVALIASASSKKLNLKIFWCGLTRSKSF